MSSEILSPSTTVTGVSKLPIELLEMIFDRSSPFNPQDQARPQLVHRQRQQRLERAVCKRWLSVSKMATSLDITTVNQLETALSDSSPQRPDQVHHLHIALQFQMNRPSQVREMRACLTRIEAAIQKHYLTRSSNTLQSLQIDHCLAHVGTGVWRPGTTRGDQFDEDCHDARAELCSCTLVLVDGLVSQKVHKLGVYIEASCQDEIHPYNMYGYVI